MDQPFPSAVGSIRGEKVIAGPLVGILCNPVWNQKRGDLKQTMQIPVLKKLIDAGTAAGAHCFLFRIEDVDFQNFRVKGYVPSGSGWSPVTLPFPDAIYDQVISRKRERTAEHSDKRAKLSKMFGHRIFNDGFFDKWQVHEWMIKDHRLRMHIPSTIRHTSTHESAVFISKHNTTFLKPIHGSLGLGIIRLVRNQDGTVAYDVKRPNNAPSHGKAQSATDVISTFRKRLRSRPYLIQEGITLSRYQDRPFDIRILLQRDGTGQWKRTKMFARVAKAGDFTSNLSSGGEAMPVSAVLSEVLPSEQQRRKCRQQIRKVSRLVTEVMEQQSEKVFGELGVDIGLDEKGGVWVIEVNSKPWKSPTTEKGRKDLVDLAFARPMQYAIRLAQQK